MPPQAFLDPSELDCSNIIYSRKEIYEVLPQQFEFSQLDGIIHVDLEQKIVAAFRDVREDEWWCRGHMPGQPIFPGVLMIEAAAQLSAFAQALLVKPNGIMGFGGIDRAKFRDSVYPPARILLIGRAIHMRNRKFRCGLQAFVDGRMAFEGEIAGIRLKMETQSPR